MERGNSFPAASYLLVFVAECIDAASWSGSAITDVGWGHRNLPWEQVSQQWQQISKWVRDPSMARAFYHALEGLEIPNFAGTRDPATYALILSEDMPDFLLPTLSWLADRAAAT